MAKSDTSIETKSEISIKLTGRAKTLDLYCVLIRRYTREVERQKFEGDDDASEDMMRKLIERVTSKIEKKIEELFLRMTDVETNVNSVQIGESDIVQLQHEHTSLVLEEGQKRETEADRFVNLLNKTKLELLARMEAERQEMVRIWEEQLRELLRKLEDGRSRVAERVAELEAVEEASRRTQSLHRPRRPE